MGKWCWLEPEATSAVNKQMLTSSIWALLYVVFPSILGLNCLLLLGMNRRLCSIVVVILFLVLSEGHPAGEQSALMALFGSVSGSVQATEWM